MSQLQQLRTFKSFITRRILTEQHEPGRVVIRCECGEQWQRGRFEGRRQTVADRATAVQHVSTQHPARLSERP
jgi:hypothetical protein